MTGYLFNDGDLWSFLNQREKELHEEINKYPEEYLLGVDANRLIASLEAKYHLEIPKLDEAGIQVDHADKQIDVSQDPNRLVPYRSRPCLIPGTSIKYFIPFAGDSILLKLQPSTHNHDPPDATVVSNEIVFEIYDLNHDEERVKSTFAKKLDNLKKYLEWVSKDCTAFNEVLKRKIEKAVVVRREKLTKDNTVANGLGFPLRKRTGAPNTYSLPEVRRKIIPSLPSSSSPISREPAIDMENYEHILKVMSNMS